MQQIDVLIIEWIRNHVVSEWLTPIFKVITYLGNYGIVWILLAVVLLCFKKHRKAGLAVGAALLLGFILGEGILKNVIQRPRPFYLWPELQLLIPQPSGFSCPSGHTTSSFAAATSLLLYRKRWGAVALVLAVLIGFSRMYFTVHYLTDVLFGIVLGIACALVVYKLWKNIERRA